MKYTEFEFTGKDIEQLAKLFKGARTAKWFVDSEMDDDVFVVNTLNVKERSIVDLINKKGLNVSMQFNSEDQEKGRFACSSYEHFGGQYYVDSDGKSGRKFQKLDDIVGPVKTDKLIEVLQDIENTSECDIEKLLAGLNQMLAGRRGPRVIKVDLIA